MWLGLDLTWWLTSAVLALVSLFGPDFMWEVGGANLDFTAVGIAWFVIPPVTIILSLLRPVTWSHAGVLVLLLYNLLVWINPAPKNILIVGIVNAVVCGVIGEWRRERVENATTDG